jgi:hypothetical protein
MVERTQLISYILVLGVTFRNTKWLKKNKEFFNI